MKKTLVPCLLCILLVFASSPGFSQQTSEVLKKMIEAGGGRKSLETIKDTTSTGTIEIIQAGMTGNLTVYQKEPNMMRWDAEVMGMVMTQACDGQTAWGTDPQTGTIDAMPEPQATDFKRDSLGIDSLLNPEKYGIRYEAKGKEQIEGKDYVVLEQTFADGHKITAYIDPDTYLTYKAKAKGISPMGGEVEVETITSDYKKVNGLTVPHSIRVFYDGQEFIKMTFTKVSFNTGLEDSLFKMK